MHMKGILIIFFIVVLFFSQSFMVDAAAKPKTISSVGSISTSVQYIKAKNVVRAFFGNLKGAKQVNYVLTYTGNGIGQGIEGSFLPGKKASFSRDLYLRTCSGKVCISHKNIKNIQLEVMTKYTNSKSSSKVYKVR